MWSYEEKHLTCVLPEKNEINIELVIYANAVWHPMILLVCGTIWPDCPCYCVKFANFLRVSHCFQEWWNIYPPKRSSYLLLYIAHSRTSVVLTKHDAKIFWGIKSSRFVFRTKLHPKSRPGQNCRDLKICFLLQLLITTSINTTTQQIKEIIKNEIRFL